MPLSSTNKKALGLIRYFDKICKDNNIWYTLTSGSVLGAVRHNGFIPWDSDIDVFVKQEDLDKLRHLLCKNVPDGMKLYIWDEEKKYHSCHDKLAYNDIPHEMIHVDIFTLIGVPNSLLRQKIFTSLCFYSYEILRCKHVNVQFSKPNHRVPIRVIKFFLQIVPDTLIKRWYHFLEHKHDFNNSEFAYTLSSGYRMRECLPKEIYLNSIKVPFEDLMLPIPKNYSKYLTSVYGDYMTPKKDGYKLIK